MPNKRKLEERDDEAIEDNRTDDLDIDALDGNALPPQENISMDEGQDMQIDAEDQRTELKLLFAQNPHLKVDTIVPDFKKIDEMTPEQLNNLKLLATAQLQRGVDPIFAERILTGLCKIIPGVNRDQLIDRVTADGILQGAWSAFIGEKLSFLNQSLKIIILFGAHIIENMGDDLMPLPKKIKLLSNDTTQTSVPTADNRTQ
jgi:hypothetical protein